MRIQWDVFGLGAVAVDDLLYVARYPGPNEKVRITGRERQGGGLTATALVTAARHGCRALFCSALGDDADSRFVLDDLRREGVDVSAVLPAPGARPHRSTIIVAADGSRNVFSDREGVARPAPADLRREWITASRVVFIDHTSGAAGVEAARLAHAAAIPVIADIETLEADHAAELLAAADHLIVNREFARRMTGREHPADALATLAALAAADRAACTVTAGAEGCWWMEAGGAAHHFPAFPVRVVDTTGCGDVFHGAYAAAIARGERVGRAIAVATAAAGLKAAHPGGRAGIPDLASVERLLAAG